jgi:hypothetical protein
MKEQLLERLEDFFRYNGIFETGTPASEAQILEAEQQLGTVFHLDYRDFIKHFGGAYVGLEIWAFEKNRAETVISLTLDFRSDYPVIEGLGNTKDYYVFSTDGSGDYIFSRPDGVVFTCYHDTGEVVELAPSLGKLIEQHLPDIDV